MLLATQPNTSEICPENFTTNRAINHLYHSSSTLRLKFTGNLFDRLPITYNFIFHYLDLIVSLSILSLTKYSKIWIELPLTKLLP